MDLVLAAAVFSFLLSVAAAVFGVNYKQAKDKVTMMLRDVIDAVQDDNVTEEELQKIIDQARYLWRNKK